MKKGTVYILTNPCLDGWIKIGCTEKNDIQERLNSLDASTSIPLSFRVYAILNVENSKETEQRIHKLLDIINPSLHSIEKLENGKVRVREFFKISPEKAYMIFKEVAAMMGISDNLELRDPTKEEQEEESMIKDTRQKTTFKNLQIPVGSELVLFKKEGFLTEEQVKEYATNTKPLNTDKISITIKNINIQSIRLKTTAFETVKYTSIYC